MGPPRSGKSTLAYYLVEAINAKGRDYALCCSLAPLWGVRDREKALAKIPDLLSSAMAASDLIELKRKAGEASFPGPTYRGLKLTASLSHLAYELDKDLILIFDDVDSLAWSPLAYFLAQINQGRQDGPKPGVRFPKSLALLSQEDLEETLARIPSGDKPLERPGSLLNFLHSTVKLRNFTHEDIKNLYLQHTHLTGQTFTEPAIYRSFFWSHGQPSLVNALAAEALNHVLSPNSRQPVTAEVMDLAAQNLIASREVPIPALAERLKEPRIISILDPTLAGADREIFLNESDRKLCVELGLLTFRDKKAIAANPLVSEALSLLLTDQIQSRFDDNVGDFEWRTGDKILMTSLIKRFQTLWRERYFNVALKSEGLDEAFSDTLKKELIQLLEADITNDLLYQYVISRINELLTHRYSLAIYSLVLLAFVQKIVGSEALVIREYGEGRGGVEAQITYKGRTYILEMALTKNGPLDRHLARLNETLKGRGDQEGWLVIFNVNPGEPWENRLFTKVLTIEERVINVFGC
jgi:hypothetical protein